MTKKIEAELCWLKPEEGGRQHLPSGPKYVTVARFSGQERTWTKESWSLVIEFAESPDKAYKHRVQVSFLTNGPDEYLQSGKTFELMEGPKLVARGLVLG